MTREYETAERQAIIFTEITLRDGEQQEKFAANMPLGDRLDVFDTLIDSGMRRIEIGHLANPHDIALATAIVRHIDEKESAGDSHYEDVKLQVLFGSQEDKIGLGLQALQGFAKDRVIVHVYDRVHSQLRKLAKTPKSAQETAQSVIRVSQRALDAGFTRFSISGEGAVNHDDPIEDTIAYYASIIGALEKMGAKDVNANLANTYGLSLGGEWGREGLRHFSNEVKAASDTITVTTTVHTHNDMNSAGEFSTAAIEEGFDGVEGPMNKNGERTGNASLTDTMVRFMESARNAFERNQRALGSLASSQVFWAKRYIPEAIIDALDTWYNNAFHIAEIYDTFDRFHGTSLGNPDAYSAGSGPHAHANLAALKDPVGNPLWKNYCTSALIHAAMGRPEAKQVLAVDPERIKAITLATHASGGSTEVVHEGVFTPAPESERKKSEAMAYEVIQGFVQLMCASTARQTLLTCSNSGALSDTLKR